jgi:hypothetical protein
MNREPTLYEALKSSYNPKKKNNLGKNGYALDSGLSNGNQQVYYNKDKKKLLYTVTGTHNLKDWATDAYLAFGGLKNTNRYKEADKTLKLAKEKYKPINTTVAGHSLGGSIAQYVGSKNDKVLTLDKGATLFQKTRSNENAFRSAGDAVSLLNSNATRMKTFENPNFRTGIISLDILRSHNVDNIKNKQIFT